MTACRKAPGVLLSDVADCHDYEPNVRAVINPLVDAAQRCVDLLGPDRIIAAAQLAFDLEDYRWVTEILHNLVIAQPDNQAARDLHAAAYERLGHHI